MAADGIVALTEHEQEQALELRRKLRDAKARMGEIEMQLLRAKMQIMREVAGVEESCAELSRRVLEARQLPADEPGRFAFDLETLTFRDLRPR